MGHDPLSGSPYTIFFGYVCMCVCVCVCMCLCGEERVRGDGKDIDLSIVSMEFDLVYMSPDLSSLTHYE